MSLKSIDLQVALPRTQDAGQLQEQMSKQHQRFQESLVHQQIKQDLLKRRQVNQYERTEGLKVSDEEEPSSKNPHQDEEEENKEKESKQIKHPYLGQKIDYSR